MCLHITNETHKEEQGGTKEVLHNWTSGGGHSRGIFGRI
jgi:hypothetical protein